MRSRLSARLVAAAALLLAACAEVSLEPTTPVFLEIDRTSYDAMPISESVGGTPNLRFRLIARLVNNGDEPVSFGRCGSATTPIYGVSLARESRARSGYDPAWGCPGSDPLVLPARSARTDTLTIHGPTGRDHFTQVPDGVLEGEFVLQYGTSRGTVSSPAFSVRRAPLTGAMVTVLNDGAVTLSNVRVITSAGDTLPLVASLTPGARVGPHAVAAMHTNPFVSAVAQGRNAVAHPIEGFSGFNPRLASGFYTVRLRLTLDGILDVRVQ